MDCCTADYPGRGHGRHHGHGHSGCGCCCCEPSCGCDPEDYDGGGFRRRFYSPQEELEELNEYLRELKKEIAGVEAEIKRLKALK